MASYVGNSPEDILKTRRRNYYYTASAAQTTFTGADDNSNTLNVNENDLEVFMNGVLLDQSDYTANTTHIVLSSAAAASDIIEVQTFNDYFVDSNFSRFGGNISGNIIPTANNTYTLGNTTNRFADLYLSGSTLHLGDQTITSNATHVSMSGAQDVTGTVSADGLIVVGTTELTYATNSRTPSLNLKNTATSGYAPVINFYTGYNGGYNVAQIQTENSSTGGSFLIQTANSAGSLVNRFVTNHLGDIYFYDTNGAQKIRWDATSEVLGIGTTSPSVPLHLQSSGKDANARFQAADNGYAARLQLYANNVSGASYNAIQSYVNGDSTVQWEISGPKASAEDQMLFHTGGSERMRIDSSGNVTVKGTNRDMLILHRQAATGDAGIEFKNNTGTRNQLLMLHGGEMRVDILGSERYSFQNLNGNSIFAVEPSSTGGAGAGGAFLKFKGSNGTAVDVAAIDGSMVDGTAGAEDGILAFFTMQNGTLTQRMQINNQGFVGLGTGWGGSFAPSHMLHVKGGDNGTSSILIDNTQTGGGRKWGLRPGSPATNNGYLTIHDETGNQNVMTFNTDGDVGIGSLQPYAPANSKHLTIFNSSMAWNQRAGVLFATEAQGTYNAEIYYHRGTTSDADTALKIRVHDTYVAAFRPDGRVWFGTNGDIIDSGLILHVKGDQAANFEATVSTGGGTVLNVNRASADGALIRLRQASTIEGTITVSGSTVSYNGGHLSRYAQSTDGERIDNLLKGTVMTNLDQMSVWYNEDGTEEDNEQLNCMAISSVEGDPNVAGVFVSWDEDDDYNDMNIAMTGDMIIRIAEGVVVERGDLLMSAGDGTAKPQGDDIVRSKTIAKVTSTHVTATYDDGSYVVPCVLMAC